MSIRPTFAPHGQTAVRGRPSDEFSLEMALRMERFLGNIKDAASLFHSKKALKIANNGTNQYQIDVDAEMLTVGGIFFPDVDITADIRASGLNGLDTGSAAANTVYHLYAIRSIDGSDIQTVFSLSASVPAYPGGYTDARRIWSGTTDATAAPSCQFYLFKNPLGTDRFKYDEDYTTGIFLVKNAVVAAVNTWEDVDLSAPVPITASAAVLEAQIYRVAPALMILRVKDKDLTNIGNVGDALTVQGGNRIGGDIDVSIDAAGKIQIQCNSLTTTVVMRVKEYEDANR